MTRPRKRRLSIRKCKGVIDIQVELYHKVQFGKTSPQTNSNIKVYTHLYNNVTIR